jgi:putative transposase
MMSYDRITQAVLRRPVELGQYTSIAFGTRCREACVRPSMGSVGDAYDNALCESFFATPECELLERQRLRTPADARAALFDYIEGWYNPRRRHSALGHLSRVIYEKTRAIDHRTVAPGSTIAAGAALAVSPALRR